MSYDGLHTTFDKPKHGLISDVHQLHSRTNPVIQRRGSQTGSTGIGLTQIAVPKHTVKFKNFIETRSKLQLSLLFLAICMIVAGAYLSIIGWRANHVAQEQASKLIQEANENNGSGAAPSTIKPSPSAVAAYAVAPNYPKYLKIPAIGVDAIVGQVGLLASGALGTPGNVYYTDWYTGSTEPGQPGATLIDGHVSSWTTHGVFYNLYKLKPGDAIQIVKGNNSVVHYRVVKTQTYPASNVNMQAAITPVTPGVSGLNLITCTGKVIKGTSEFNERVIVFAQEVS